jgi:hypothetical protein
MCGMTAICTVDLSAQSSVWFSSINYESPVLIAPVVVLYIPSETEISYSVGVLGWTLSGGISKNINKSIAYGVSTEITPLNSHSSNTLYRNGKEDQSLTYKNRTAQLRASMTINHSIGWKSELALLGLYESVAGLQDKSIIDFWKKPFAGIEIQESYSSTTSNDPLRFRFDGLQCSGKMQLYYGSKPWWRGEFTASAGKEFGNYFLSGNGTYLVGNSLNIVNQFLVGGSWDILTSTALYGYHYAEFRLDKALLINGGIDVAVVEDVEISLRVGYLNSSVENTYGECLKISSVWQGISFNAGISFPEDEIFNGTANKVIVFAGITAAIFTQ